MPKAINVKNNVGHVTAGFSTIHGIEDWWRKPKSQGGPGWSGKGYATITELSGKIWYLNDPTAKYGYVDYYNDGKCFEFITNGVAGFNASCIHHADVGGIEKVNGIFVPKDTRTPEQMASRHIVLQQSISWLKANGKDVTKDLGYVGHRDFSIDKNKNGVIESFERNKECPSFDIIGSVEHFLYSSADRFNKLPTQK